MNDKSNTATQTEQQAAQDTAEMASATNPQTDNAQAGTAEPKPDVSDQSASELLPKLLAYFHNNTEEFARAIAVDRSMVDDWLAGNGGPNESTLLRMRRIAQERRIE